MSSVKLYAYDVAAEHHINTSKQISPDRYSVKYDQAKGQISVTLPDELPCVLVYEYEIDKDSVVNDAEVKNDCSLDGSWSSGDAIKLHEISSSASASHKRITLYKVDEDNNQKLLDGAVFSLERWDVSSQSWVMENSSVAPAGGVFTWDVGGANPPLDADALYRLVETTPPDGYALDATPHYFIWMDTANNASTSYNDSGASSAKKPGGSTGISQSDIALFKNAGGMLYVSDKYTRLTVKKEWATEDGSATDAPAGSNVQVKLKRFLRAADPDQTCTVHIHAEGTETNGWADKPIDLGPLDIQRGSALTLKINMWNGVPMKALVNGKEYANFTLTGQGYYTLTIDADQLKGATADVDIVVTNAGNVPKSIDVVDYTKPAAKNSDEMVVDTVTLDASNGWEKSWENLPVKDDAGNPYRYAVEEAGCSVPTKGVAYTNDDGIQTGTIAVTNTIGEDYTLPATGGHGVWPWVAGGAMIVAAAAAGIVARRRVRRMR
jgi:LPXTG-motif cell wall-anchored protein